jgi:hypothetical protein
MSSTSPYSARPTERYDAASKTNASSQSPALTRSNPPPSLNRSSLSSSCPTVGLPLTVTLMTCLALGHPPAVVSESTWTKMLQGCLNVLGAYWRCDRHAASLTTLWSHRFRPLHNETKNGRLGTPQQGAFCVECCMIVFVPEAHT